MTVACKTFPQLKPVITLKVSTNSVYAEYADVCLRMLTYVRCSGADP